MGYADSIRGGDGVCRQYKRGRWGMQTVYEGEMGHADSIRGGDGVCRQWEMYTCTCRRLPCWM